MRGIAVLDAEVDDILAFLTVVSQTLIIGRIIVIQFHHQIEIGFCAAVQQRVDIIASKLFFGNGQTFVFQDTDRNSFWVHFVEKRKTRQTCCLVVVLK